MNGYLKMHINLKYHLEFKKQHYFGRWKLWFWNHILNFSEFKIEIYYDFITQKL